jgi:hypothetical protein
VIDDKIIQYKAAVARAKILAERNLADQDYYRNLATRLERLLTFYEKLKNWKEI